MPGQFQHDGLAVLLAEFVTEKVLMVSLLGVSFALFGMRLASRRVRFALCLGSQRCGRVNLLRDWT
jgi:hypothetical protein